MVTLISILVSILFACEVALVKYCQVKKRSLVIFSLFVMILAFTALMVTGDITLAYGGLE